ncbi:MAG: MBL fold metallo-hydrolase [Thermotogota bacterium]
MEITFLGTAGAIPTATRTNTSLWVENNKTAILIDCSGDILHKLKRYTLHIERLGHVIITHGHIDHTFGLPSLIESLRLEGRKQALHLYINEDAFKKQYEILESCKLLHREDGFPIIFHSIPFMKGYHLLALEGFDAFTHPVKHVIPNVAIRLSNGMKSFTYSSDTEPFEGFVDFAMKTDVLIHECMVAKWFSDPLVGHSRTDQVGKIAQQVQAKILYPVHFSPKIDENPERFKAEIAQEYTGEIIIPYDGFKFRLKDDKIEKI